MARNELETSRQSFDSMATDGKLGILFDIAIAQQRDIYDICVSIKRNKKIDGGIAAASGLGGAILFLAAKWAAIKVLVGGS